MGFVSWDSMTTLEVLFIVVRIPETSPQPSVYPQMAALRTRWSSPLYRTAIPEVHAFNSRCGWRSRVASWLGRKALFNLTFTCDLLLVNRLHRPTSRT